MTNKELAELRSLNLSLRCREEDLEEKEREIVSLEKTIKRIKDRINELEKEDHGTKP
jgi:hypothetical protein